jgi:GT2 family glycosyltransferase
MTEDSISAKPLRIIVGIATAGRREVLTKTIELLARQTCLPATLIICPVRTDDVNLELLEQFPAPTRIVTGATGSSAQRNLLLSAAGDADIIAFFDDDFFAERNYLANLETLFLRYPDVVAVSGECLEDGAPGPGLSIKEGEEILHSKAKTFAGSEQPTNTYGTYGCNMSFRLDTIRRNDLLFDENLPLYGWQEDIDFSRRLARYGRMISSQKLLGVHLGIKIGRTSGVRLGYSQIANPIYLLRKGTVTSEYVRSLLWRNITANLLRTLRPEPWIDRKGRLKGNVIALIDLATGRLSPRRILELR